MATWKIRVFQRAFTSSNLNVASTCSSAPSIHSSTSTKTPMSKLRRAYVLLMSLCVTNSLSVTTLCAKLSLRKKCKVVSTRPKRRHKRIQSEALSKKIILSSTRERLTILMKFLTTLTSSLLQMMTKTAATQATQQVITRQSRRITMTCTRGCQWWSAQASFCTKFTWSCSGLFDRSRNLTLTSSNPGMSLVILTQVRTCWVLIGSVCKKKTFLTTTRYWQKLRSARGWMAQRKPPQRCSLQTCDMCLASSIKVSGFCHSISATLCKSRRFSSKT